MSELRILHIVPWFPNPENEIEGVFIAKHILALQNHCKNAILHVRFGSQKKVELNGNYDGIPLDRITLKPLIDKWRVKELMAAKTIKNYLKTHVEAFDHVNFYIAYPNAIRVKKLKFTFQKLHFSITEQWSAYHNEFNLAPENKGRQRIADIFQPDIPLFVVSNALGQDIQKFARQPELQYKVIPNIVDDQTFYYQPKTTSETFTFCSINSWSTMKNPLILVEAFALLHQIHPHTRLVLAGSGQLDEAIKNKIKTLNLTNVITVLGRIDKKEVVKCLHEAQVYCQSSNYETFSAICIEALATGTPVIATNIGGMKDFITPQNGRLVDEMTTHAWKNELEDVLLNYSLFSFEAISQTCIQQFNADRIGQLFFKSISIYHHEK